MDYRPLPRPCQWALAGQPTVIGPVVLGTSSTQVLPGARATGLPLASVSASRWSWAVFVQVTVTVLPPDATSASPVPTNWVSGTRLPAGSNALSRTTSTRTTTTFAAASRAPSAPTDGVVLSERSHFPSGALQVQVG